MPISPGVTSQKRIIYTTDGKDMSKEESDIVKKIGGVFIKKTTRCVKDYKKEDYHQLQIKGVFYPHIGKRSSKVSKTYNTSNHEVFKKYERKKKCLKK